MKPFLCATVLATSLLLASPAFAHTLEDIVIMIFTGKDPTLEREKAEEANAPDQTGATEKSNAPAKEEQKGTAPNDGKSK